MLDLAGINENYSSFTDVEKKLGSTLVKKLSAQVGKRKALENNNWIVDDKLGNELSNKLGNHSSGNVYAVGDKFIVKYNLGSNVWTIEI
jgi:hypothetical protein